MTAEILFLDDTLFRHEQFGRLVERRGEDVRIWKAYTAAEAIGLLGRVVFAQVFLDHDLCDEDAMCAVGAITKEQTGMVVVEHILTMGRPPQDVIVHSLNGPARDAMRHRLADSGRIKLVRAIPFSELVTRLR